jgi:hypothetical protein
MDDTTKVPPDVDDFDTLAVKVVPHIAEDLRLLFSDSILVQHTPTEFTITFAQVRQPIITDAAGFEGLTEIRADVVARIVLTPAKMAEFIKALRENWGLYQRRIKKLVEEQRIAMVGQENAGTIGGAKNAPSED